MKKLFTTVLLAVLAACASVSPRDRIVIVDPLPDRWMPWDLKVTVKEDGAYLSGYWTTVKSKRLPEDAHLYIEVYDSTDDFLITQTKAELVERVMNNPSSGLPHPKAVEFSAFLGANTPSYSRVYIRYHRNYSTTDIHF